MLDATPLLRLYARYRLARLAAQKPETAQRRVFRRLIAAARDTRFGRDHAFSDIATVADFQARVPLGRYEDFWVRYWKDAFPNLVDLTWPGHVPYFAVTSGTTTGVTKYIPCTGAMVAANTRAGADVLVHHVANRPASRILAGRSFVLGGSTDLTELAPGVHAGDLSGIAVAAMRWWARKRYFPPLNLALLSDWDEKIARLAPLSLTADIRMVAGTPSWLLVFFEKLAALKPGAGRDLAPFYPRLELLVHGGVDFAPYRKLFEEWLAGTGADTREVYPASEGFFAIADHGADDGLRLILDNGVFYEFVPVDELDAPHPRRHWIGDAEIGVDYALVVSTCAGLWAYIVGDTVELVTRDPPRIRITGRTGFTLSAFGEHLILAEIEAAVGVAADSIGAAVTDYAVGAVFPENQSAQGGHLYIVEFADGGVEGDRLARFSEALDRVLCADNEDYAAHRAGNLGMMAPRVHVLAPGGFTKWMRARGQLGGQHKVPRVVNDRELFESLCRFAGCD